MANKEHLQPLMAAISSTNLEAWNQWRKQNPDLRPDLSEANLSNADLRIVNLSDANMSRSNFADANLAGANFNGASLTDAILCRADLTDADLRCANLKRADLTGANLTNADMRFADLRGANLTDAKLFEARVNPSALKRAIRGEEHFIHSRAKAEASQIVAKGHFLGLKKVKQGGPSEDKPRYPGSVEPMIAKMRLTKRKFAERRRQMQEELARTKMRLESESLRRVGEARQKEEMIAKMQLTERKFEERKRQMQEELTRTRMRLESEFLRRVGEERQRIVLPFLEVLDNLERALASVSHSGICQNFLQGVELIANQVRDKLQSNGVEVIPVLNQPFDPNLGHAVGVVAVTDPTQDGLVVEELQHGYRIDGQLLRPAQVRVGHLSIVNTPLPRL